MHFVTLILTTCRKIKPMIKPSSDQVSIHWETQISDRAI